LRCVKVIDNPIHCQGLFGGRRTVDIEDLIGRLRIRAEDYLKRAERSTEPHAKVLRDKVRSCGEAIHVLREIQHEEAGQ
jgi:hypothetical protein